MDTLSCPQIKYEINQGYGGIYKYTVIRPLYLGICLENSPESIRLQS